MGREAVAVCHWQGEIAEAKLHLDGRHLQLRGPIRADIPRDAIAAVEIVEEGVRVVTSGPVLVFECGADAALRWKKALLKKPPSLAEKLGVSAQAPAFVLGDYDDETLAEALRGAKSGDVGDAHILVAVLLAADQLEIASSLALAHRDKHIWMVHEKGKKAVVGDTAVRTHMRGLGFIDSKTSAISDVLTATRYRLRKE